MRAFKLLKNMTGLNKGLVFVYDQANESLLGSPAFGCLILAWDNGDCQNNYDKNGNWEGGWCGGTFILPGQLAKDSKWFEEIENPAVAFSSKGQARPHQYYIKISKHTSVSIS